MRFAAYNETAIYGIGETAEAARKDAREWLDDPAQTDGLQVAPISDRLVTQVDVAGGDYGHTMLDGVLVTWDEAEEAEDDDMDGDLSTGAAAW